jgi:hypothetical protein
LLAALADAESMKSFAGPVTAILLSCAVPIISPLLARGSEPAPVAARAVPVPAAAAAASEQPAIVFWTTPSGPYWGSPPVTRLQILDIARSALGRRYVHGGESWSRAPSRLDGVDCSGLIAKAWQLPRAVESWEELPARPTTETLSVSTQRWQKLPIAERRPGDALVRYEEIVKHAFIYERDDANYAENSRIWVYEAAEPRVKHVSYALAELAQYSLVRREGIDDVGLVGRSRNYVFGDMVDAFRRAGGEAALGTPYDRGEGVLVHAWSTAGDDGVAQDFHGGELGRAQLVRSQRRPGTFLVSGALLRGYAARGGPSGALGAPIAEQAPFGSCGATAQPFVGGRLIHGCDGRISVEPNP